MPGYEAPTFSGSAHTHSCIECGAAVVPTHGVIQGLHLLACGA